MTKQYTNIIRNLLEGYLTWFSDNDVVDNYIHISVEDSGSDVLNNRFKDNPHLVLNIGPEAVRDFRFEDTCISFSAKFNGVSERIHIEYDAIIGVTLPITENQNIVVDLPNLDKVREFLKANVEFKPTPPTPPRPTLSVVK